MVWNIFFLYFRLADYIDFDCAAAVWGLECFHAIILLINGQYCKDIVNFLSKVGKYYNNNNHNNI